MKAYDAKDLAGWVSLVHPEILEEFLDVKKQDPDFLNIPPSQEYFDVKNEIDDLIKSSNIDFVQKVFNPKYKDKVGYYYKDKLAFIYDRTCLAGGCKPHFTYWENFFQHENADKERCSNFHIHCYAYSSKPIKNAVKKILVQISEHKD